LPPSATRQLPLAAPSQDTRFERLCESNVIGVAIVNTRGDLVFANDYYLCLLGCSRAELQAGRLTAADITAPDQGPGDALAHAEVQTSGASRSFEKHYLRRDGATSVVELVLASLPGEHDQVIAIARDIGVRKRALHDLETANRLLAARSSEAEAANLAKSHFLSNVNHELRTPVHTMLGYVRLLLRHSQGEDRRMLEAAEHSGVQLQRLIDDLLEFTLDANLPTRLRPVGVRLTELIGQLAEVGHALAQRGRNQFGVQLGDALPDLVWVDEQRLAQVLQNLLGNACKYTTGGRVTLALERAETAADVHAGDGAADRVGDRDHTRLRFAVHDTGSGIALADQARIFEPFQRGGDTPSLPGLGLGLSIARHWVQAMGGDLGVRSAPGLGSSFTFELSLPTLRPRLQVAAPATRPCKLPPGASAWPGATLLVVDDTATNRAYLRDVCEDWGYRVIEAADGAAALAQCVAATPHIDAVLVDQFMPVLDGWGLLERLRATPVLAALPVLLISASGLQRPLGLGPQVTFDAWTGKPLDERALKCFLCRHVGHPQAASGACHYVGQPADGGSGSPGWAGAPATAWTAGSARARSSDRADLADPANAAAAAAAAALPLPGAELAVLNDLLDLGRLFAIEDWAHALAARIPDHAGFVELVLRHCRQGDVAGLQLLAATATAHAAHAAAAVAGPAPGA
jgi:PAS domain S-box-containing protein